MISKKIRAYLLTLSFDFVFSLCLFAMFFAMFFRYVFRSVILKLTFYYFFSHKITIRAQHEQKASRKSQKSQKVSLNRRKFLRIAESLESKESFWSHQKRAKQKKSEFAPLH